MTQHKESIIKRAAPQMFRDSLELCTWGPEEQSVLMGGSVTARKKKNDSICLTNWKPTRPPPQHNETTTIKQIRRVNSTNLKHLRLFDTWGHSLTVHCCSEVKVGPLQGEFPHWGSLCLLLKRKNHQNSKPTVTSVGSWACVHRGGGGKSIWGVCKDAPEIKVSAD